METSEMAEHSLIERSIVWFSCFAVIYCSIYIVATMATTLFTYFFALFTQPAAAQNLEPEVRRRPSPPARRAVVANPAYDFWPRRDYDDEIHE